VRHYELIIFYCLGGRPTEAIKRFGVSRTVAYSWFHRYKRGLRSLGYSSDKQSKERLARKLFEVLEKKVPEVIFVPFFVPPGTKEKPIPLDELSDG